MVIHEALLLVDPERFGFSGFIGLSEFSIINILSNFTLTKNRGRFENSHYSRELIKVFSKKQVQIKVWYIKYNPRKTSSREVKLKCFRIHK